jgi:aspartyl-tRNA synthetase
MMRTDRAGDLRTTDIDREVVVCGWVDGRRDHGGVVFLDVRDVAGILQVVVDPGARDGEDGVGADVHRVRNEFVVRIVGTVRHRPEGTVNDTLPTGEIEVAAAALEVLNEAETPPFPVDDRIDADEMLRLRHR